MKFAKFYELVEGKIGGVFAAYGRFVSRHAWKIIFITTIINGALGVGMLRLTSDINTGNVYFPLGSQARKDKDRVENIFPDLTGTNFNSLQLTDEPKWARIIVRSKGGNLLNREELEEVRNITDHIEAITATDDDGNPIKYEDFCAMAQNLCVVEGDLFWDSDFLESVKYKNVTYPSFTTRFGTKNYASDIGGNQSFDSTGKFLTGMEYIKISFMIRTDGSKIEEKAIKWAKEFNKYMAQLNSEKLEMAYGHFKSRDEELDKNVSGDITLFSITMTLMITYACTSTLSARY